MRTLVTTLQGRFGNQAMQWLFAYSFALQNQMRFECEPWIGERIFELPIYSRPSRRDYERVNEISIFGSTGDVEFRGYAQCQRCMIYSKRHAQAWLKLRPQVESACRNQRPGVERIVCHIRRGDLIGYGYPQVSEMSYFKAMRSFGFDPNEANFLTEERPTKHGGLLPDDLGFMPDFFRMMTAPTLLRGNSTFSWLAALLSDGLVLSPVMDGLEGGKEHLCRFVAGNHPRFVSHLDYVTDLHVNP